MLRFMSVWNGVGVDFMKFVNFDFLWGVLMVVMEVMRFGMMVVV